MKLNELLNTPVTLPWCRAKTEPKSENEYESEWVEGYCVKLNCRSYRILPGSYEQDGDVLYPDYYDVDADTIGLYTGVNDTKRTEEFPEGQPIFVGDIVDGMYRCGMTFKSVVVFESGSYGLAWVYNGFRHFSAFTSICNVNLEVIGNIHDNEELLEEM